MADYSVVAPAGHPADRHRAGLDHQPDRSARAVVDPDRGRPRAHRARGRDARGIGAVGAFLGHPAWSAVILGVFAAACFLAAYAASGWQW